MTVFASDSQIRGLDIGAEHIRDALRAAFRALGSGEASLVPKLGLYPTRGGLFHAMPASIGDLVVVKWLAIGAERSSIAATLLVNDRRSGELLAVMDAAWITAARTAGVSALFLELAGRARGRVAFIGCGLQAHAHLDALHQLGVLGEVAAFSRSRQSAEVLSTAARQVGVPATVSESAADSVDGADIVLSMVPFTSNVAPFLDARDIKPDAIAIAVDLGVSWRRETFEAFGTIATDVRAQTESVTASGIIPRLEKIDFDLVELEAGGPKLAGPTLFLPPGVAIADAAVAALVLDRLTRQV